MRSSLNFGEDHFRIAEAHEAIHERVGGQHDAQGLGDGGTELGHHLEAAGIDDTGGRFAEKHGKDGGAGFSDAVDGTEEEAVAGESAGYEEEVDQWRARLALATSKSWRDWPRRSARDCRPESARVRMR